MTNDLINREDAVNAIYHHFPQLSRTDAEQVLYEVESVRSDGDTISRQATIDYLIANVPHDDYGDELDADELREMWTERINKIPSTEPHLVNESQGLVNKDDALRSIEQYIDKFDCIDVNFLNGLKTAMQLIRELPSAEPQIIRCKDCKHWIPYDWMFSEIWQSKNIADYPEDDIGCDCCDMAMKANDFCSRAERRTE